MMVSFSASVCGPFLFKRIIMLKQDFVDYVEKNPDLTTLGFGVDTDIRFHYNHANEHQDLKNYQEAVEVCKEMLTKEYLISALAEDTCNSYHLKHLAERYARDVLGKNIYIPEGAFVVAVLCLGLPYKRCKTTPGILIRLKKK